MHKHELTSHSSLNNAFGLRSQAFDNDMLRGPIIISRKSVSMSSAGLQMASCSRDSRDRSNALTRVPNAWKKVSAWEVKTEAYSQSIRFWASDRATKKSASFTVLLKLSKKFPLDHPRTISVRTLLKYSGSFLPNAVVCGLLTKWTMTSNNLLSSSII